MEFRKSCDLHLDVKKEFLTIKTRPYDMHFFRIYNVKLIKIIRFESLF